MDLTEHLDEVQIRKLWFAEEMVVEEELAKRLSVFLTSDSEVDEREVDSLGKVTFSAQSIRIVRGHVSNHLNMLEIIATAWRCHVADRKMIEEEFVGIFTKNGRPRYLTMAQISGAYPSLRQLSEKIEQNLAIVEHRMAAA